MTPCPPAKMPRSERSHPTPRAVVHKRILDAAEAQPDASLEDLASDIAGASIELVEQVLEEYGDPVDAGPEQPTNETDGETGGVEDQATSEDGSAANSASPDPEDLSERQLETLRTVRSRLSATQREIGQALGLSASAVSNRLQGIEGFEWDDREAFVSEVFDAPVLADGQGATVSPAETGELEERLDELESRLDTLADGSDTVELPLELAHKAIHAVVRSDQIDEDEELQVIKALL